MITLCVSFHLCKSLLSHFTEFHVRVLLSLQPHLFLSILMVFYDPAHPCFPFVLIFQDGVNNRDAQEIQFVNSDDLICTPRLRYILKCNCLQISHFPKCFDMVFSIAN